MKPQCTTAAECLRELARVMEQFGISKSPIDAASSPYVKEKDVDWGYPYIPAFNNPEHWQFAIAEVEGKPVFIGDELYEKSHFACMKLTIAGLDSVGNIICYAEKGERSIRFVADELSWNPPRPKTVMVETTVEDAEFEAGRRIYSFDECAAYAERKAVSYKKALEELK